MKYHVLIFLFAVSALASCRSNKEIHKISESEIESQSTVSTQRKDSTGSSTNQRDSISNIITENQYIRTTWYRPDGTIQAIQDSWREARHEELAVHDSGSSSVSVNEEKTDSTTRTKMKTFEKADLKSFSDSRPVQGVEWLWIVLPIVAGALVLVLLLYLKYRKKNG